MRDGVHTGDATMKPVNLRPSAASRSMLGVLKSSVQKTNQAVWIAFDLTTPNTVQLSLRYTGAAGSQMLVNGKLVEDAKPSTAVAHTFSKGTHRVQVQIRGQRRGPKTEVRVNSLWMQLAKSKNWSAASATDRLLMISQAPEAIASDELRKRAGNIATRLRAINNGMTTTLIAQELQAPRDAPA